MNGALKGVITMTIKELYEWAKERNAEEMTLHVYTWGEGCSALVVEGELAIVDVDGTKRVVIQK
jgi:hypothetical protein